MTGPRIALLAVVASATVVTVAWAQLPPGAQIGPGGVRAELSVPDAKGGIWRVRAYRPERPSNSPHPPRGEIDLCLAVDKGGKHWSGIVCGITAAIALRLDRHGMRTDCGAGSYIVGEPIPPAPTCGLVAPDVESVTVTAGGFPPQAAALSEPFQIRVNQSRRVLERAGLSVERVRALPPVLTMRAYLAFVNTPPTQPGERTPRVTVTGARANGETVSRSFGAHRIPETDRAQVSVRGPDGRVWRLESRRTPSAELYWALSIGAKRRGIGTGGADWHGLGGLLAKEGSLLTTLSGPTRRAGYAALGFAHGNAARIDVTDWRGRAGRARLSRAWTSVPRAGRPVRVRSFLAVLPGKGPVPAPPLHDWVEVSTTLADGRVLKTRDTP